MDNSLGLEFNTHDKKSEDELAAERAAADHAAQQKAAEEERLRRIEKNKTLLWEADDAAKPRQRWVCGDTGQLATCRRA